MNIIYILTSLALIISYLLLNKSEKKENLIHSVIISVILFLTYNIFITHVRFGGISHEQSASNFRS